MAKGYEVTEACGFASEYLGDSQPSMKRIWESEEEPTMTDMVLEGKPKDQVLDDVLLHDIHGFVLDNLEATELHRQ